MKVVLIFFVTFFCFESILSQRDSITRLDRIFLLGSSYYSNFEKSEQSVLRLKSRLIPSVSYQVNMNLTTTKNFDLFIGGGLGVNFCKVFVEDSIELSNGVEEESLIIPNVFFNASYGFRISKERSLKVGFQIKRKIQLLLQYGSVGYGINVGFDKRYEKVILGIHYYQRFFYTGFSREIAGLGFRFGF